VPNLENEKEVQAEGVIGTMDVFNPDVSTAPQVIEIKSTRAKPRGELPPHYLRQGAYYCIMTGKTKFTLVTQHINHGDIIFYDVEFTEEELSQFYADFISGRDILADAYDKAEYVLKMEKNEANKRSELLFIFDRIPMCRDSIRWKCNSCLYHSLCYISEPEKPKKGKK
jgi:hypothetical protein